MNVNITKEEVISLIKSVHLPHGQLKPVLECMGKWSYDMNGPTSFTWDEKVFEKLDIKELYNLYQDLSSGKLFTEPKPNEQTVVEAVKLPEFKRQFPTLK